MDLTTLMAYVFNCAVCTTIAIIFLLSPIKKQAQGKIDSYSKAKRCLAASAFIEALACLLYINCIVKAEPYIQLDHFTKPLFLYVAICIDLAAIVNLLHGKHAKARTIIFFVSPVAFLWLLHLIIYRRLRTELRSPAIQLLSHHNAVAHHVPFALCGVLHRVHHHPHCRQQTRKHLQAAYRQLLLGRQPEP